MPVMASSPSVNDLCLVVRALPKPQSAAERLSDEILVMIFEEVSVLYSERSPKSDEAFCFRIRRMSKPSKLIAPPQASYVESQ